MLERPAVGQRVLVPLASRVFALGHVAAVAERTFDAKLFGEAHAAVLTVEFGTPGAYCNLVRAARCIAACRFLARSRLLQRHRPPRPVPQFAFFSLLFSVASRAYARLYAPDRPCLFPAYLARLGMASVLLLYDADIRAFVIPMHDGGDVQSEPQVHSTRRARAGSPTPPPAQPRRPSHRSAAHRAWGKTPGAAT